MSLGKSSGWIIDSVNDHTISVSKYNPLAGRSYIKLPKELDYPRKGLIKIQNIDNNECFKWSIVKHTVKCTVEISIHNTAQSFGQFV